MTANIQQTVVARRRPNLSFTVRSSTSGTWQTRRTHTRTTWQPIARFGQRGSITGGTLSYVLAIIALLAIAGLGFIYLHQVFNTADHTTNIQALESQLLDLQEQQRQLELQGAELRSIQTVEERVKDLNLVATDKVSYLPHVADRVALSAPATR